MGDTWPSHGFPFGSLRSIKNLVWVSRRPDNIQTPRLIATILALYQLYSLWCLLHYGQSQYLKLYLSIIQKEGLGCQHQPLVTLLTHNPRLSFGRSFPKMVLVMTLSPWSCPPHATMTLRKRSYRWWGQGKALILHLINTHRTTG